MNNHFRFPIRLQTYLKMVDTFSYSIPVTFIEPFTFSDISEVIIDDNYEKFILDSNPLLNKLVS